MTKSLTDTDAPPVFPAVRLIRAVLAALLALGSLAWSADLYRGVGLLLEREQFLGGMLGTGLALVYLHVPFKRGTKRGRLPWYDALTALIGFATGWYVAFIFPDLNQRLIDPMLSGRVIDRPMDALIVAVIFYVLCLEGLRRAVGYPLVIVVLAFSIYAMMGHLVPGQLQTRDMKLVRLIVYLGLDTNGLLSYVMYIGATVVITFIFFGQLLLHSGASQFFNDISLALMGRYRGGAAKIAVTASSLFGSISGIVVSNIVATGVITIALMKKSGFSPRLAAAIEATASTGGQLMPPVMGAVAFLMADFLARPYTDIVVAALVPSLLYYVALFIQADLEAAKAGIERVEESQIPRLRDVLSTGWIFIIPFAVLIYVLFWMHRRAEEAAIFASISVLILGLAFGYQGKRMKLRDVVDALIATGLASVDILMIVAGAGFIIGILQVTGLGFALTLFLVDLGAGNLVALLIIASLMCIVLGMGMPTLGVYILLAILIAPSLVEVGIDPLAAHMFILYLGMMSFVTPPVAIGAFFAASLAGAEPMRTGFTAMRFGWTAYIVPFLFVFSPSLLLQGESLVVTIIAVASAIAGVWLVSAGMTGYLIRRLPVPMRAALIVAGVLLLVPSEIGPWAVWTDPIGAVLGILLCGFEISAVRRARSVDAAAPATGWSSERRTGPP